MIKRTEALCSTQVRFDFEHACAWLQGEHILTCTLTETFHFQVHLSLSLFAPLTSVNVRER